MLFPILFSTGQPLNLSYHQLRFVDQFGEDFIHSLQYQVNAWFGRLWGPVDHGKRFQKIPGEI